MDTVPGFWSLGINWYVLPRPQKPPLEATSLGQRAHLNPQLSRMHFQTSASLLALLGGLSHVQAYWLVASAITGFGGPVGGTGNQWLVADSLDCDVLNNAGLVNSASDVSSNDGVRVVWGDGDCANWPGTGCPTVAEQHFPDFHRSKCMAVLACRDVPIERQSGLETLPTSWFFKPASELRGFGLWGPSRHIPSSFLARWRRRGEILLCPI
ncbi:uncharacterized protein F5Z01DRAFT_169606 [Emericellopsis atlantica]|uniref:Uncharacterized protein n=1 Tax=Emericellopsis atlantica TaxID=2614577 RepID=A0A9P8CMQ6_9HYPO|nr:uncharacterized protein F5Z01DRAFT_169606 [Emericellopsis atlantica]KAG9252959.1 hypothetical protein F5Z01DRAFT_169606 [Emericellopsis atlantica]